MINENQNQNQKASKNEIVIFVIIYKLYHFACTIHRNALYFMVYSLVYTLQVCNSITAFLTKGNDQLHKSFDWILL